MSARAPDGHAHDGAVTGAQANDPKSEKKMSLPGGDPPECASRDPHSLARPRAAAGCGVGHVAACPCRSPDGRFGPVEHAGSAHDEGRSVPRGTVASNVSPSPESVIRPLAQILKKFVGHNPWPKDAT